MIYSQLYRTVHRSRALHDSNQYNYNKTMNNQELKSALQQIIQNQQPPTTADPQSLLQTALDAYQTARTDGLCHEGAYEIALETLKNSL
jgi:hypothetical protein